ncbi:PspC domain-containing protein [bacterium]|nr:PspC domain-containing protein [bacterium]
MNKKLKKDSDDIIFTGVCSGIAKYVDVDPIAIRLIFLCLMYTDVPMVFIYFILTVIMAED